MAGRHAHKLIVYGIDESLENKLNSAIKMPDAACREHIRRFYLELENDVKQLMLRKGYLLSSSTKVQKQFCEYNISEFKKYGDLIAVTQVDAFLSDPKNEIPEKTVKETVFCTRNPSRDASIIFSELMRIYEGIGMVYHNRDEISHIENEF